MNDLPIYLDHNSTTPVDPEVTEALLPYLREHWGNPSSTHAYGRRARAAVDQARAEVGELIGASAAEITFTSGATESNNWVVQSIVAGSTFFPHIVTSPIEHPSILNAGRSLERQGRCSLTVVSVDSVGRVDPAEIAAAIKPNTVLISLMHANNEVGTLQPIAEVSALARKHNLPLHVDAAQSVGKIPVDVDALGADFLSVAGHKCYAPKGIGALYIRSGRTLDPLIHGAGHERGLRSGTESVPLVVGLGHAAVLCGRYRDKAAALAGLRDRLLQRLQQGARVVMNGPSTNKLPNTLSVNFLDTTGADVLRGAQGVAASTGPACHDGVVRLSHVLAAMGVPLELGRGAVRLSLGRSTTEEKVDAAADQLIASYRAVSQERSLS